MQCISVPGTREHACASSNVHMPAIVHRTDVQDPTISEVPLSMGSVREGVLRGV